MKDIFGLSGVILFLALASMSLAIRFRLTKHENDIMKDKKNSKSIMVKIIKDSFMIK